MQYPNFTIEDVEANFDCTDFKRGRTYALESRVRLAVMNGDILEGEVVGSKRKVYAQTIDFDEDADGMAIYSECTCPVEYNCKHAVAVLLEYYERHEGTAVAPSRPGQLPWAVASWLHLAAAVLTQHSAVAPSKTSNTLVFILSPDATGHRVQLLACKARVLKSGALSSAVPISDAFSLANNPPAYLKPEDRFPVGLYIALFSGDMRGRSTLEPRAEIGAQLLNHLLDERRLYWAAGQVDLKAGNFTLLTRGPERAAALAWEDGDIQRGARLAFQYDDGRTATGLIPTVPPMYVDNGELGTLRLPSELAKVPFSGLLNLVEEAPRINAADIPMLSEALKVHGIERAIRSPGSPKPTLRRGLAPRPCLLLGSLEGAGEHQDFAVLTFDYDGQRAPADFGATLGEFGYGAHPIIERDQKAERSNDETLVRLGFRPHQSASLSAVAGAFGLPGAAEWLNFAQAGLPMLRNAGWQVDMAPAYRYNVLEIEDWYADVDQDEGAGQAWFDLELGIVVNQQRVSLLPILLRLIRNAPHNFSPEALAGYTDSEPLLARLPGGASVMLPWSRVRPILDVLGELFFVEHVGDSMRLTSLDAARLAQLENAAQLRWMGGERLLAAGRRLAQFDGIRSVAAPAGLQATMRPYQSEGLAWMQFLREYDLAGILADDMGLGKTLQTLAHILFEKEAGRLTAPALVVAPTSLMGNWQAEAARFAPGLRVLLLHGTQRIDRFDQIDQHDLVLTTYALLPRDEAVLCAQSFHLLVLDESQYIKNSRAKAAQTAALIPARHRLCLTGTPLQNHLGELWSQFHFLLPGLLGDEKRFNAEFRKPIEKQGDSQRNAFLIRRIKPFLLRRTKDAVATELPGKTEIVREIELDGAQRDLYETVRLAMDKKVREEIDKKGVARSQIVILDALLKLRQVCCDPRLVKLAAAGRQAVAPSAKLGELMRMIEELLDAGRKILVFSQFTSMLALIEAELEKRGIAYALLTGETRERTAQVDAFQQGKVPLFLISLKAGGVGLNLTAADTVIHYDPWWNPAVENQATDRAWRIGQDKPVFVYKLIAKGTLEEKIQAMQRDKAALADAILDDGVAHKLTMTAEDLQAIFAPLLNE
ncbi:MAG: DEAD/DEAH box helicase [Telluria sp.]